MKTLTYTRLPSEFDSCPYQVVKEFNGGCQTVAGFSGSIEGDAHCMALNAANTDPSFYYALEMGGDGPWDGFTDED
jgi:hypothetical protein